VANPAPQTLRGLVPLPFAAVISDPERSAASTTTTPKRDALRSGGCALESRVRAAHVPSGISEIAAPPEIKDRRQQIRMFRRIKAIVAAGQHGDGAAVQAGAMRRLVDAAPPGPEANDETGLGQFARQHA